VLLPAHAPQEIIRCRVVLPQRPARAGVAGHVEVGAAGFQRVHNIARQHAGACVRCVGDYAVNLLPDDADQSLDPPDARVRQGMLEGSNVNPILEITNLIEIQRAYESVTRMIEGTNDLSRRAVERLGRA
jgi:hypothetical protein